MDVGFIQSRFQRGNVALKSAMIIGTISLCALAAFAINHWGMVTHGVKVVSLPDLEREFDANPAAAEQKYADQPVRFSGVVSGQNDGDLLLETIYVLPVRVNGLAYLGSNKGQKVTIQCDRVLLWQFLASSKPNPDGCTQL